MKNRLKAMESYLRLAALEFNNPVQDTAHYALALTLDYFETYDNLHNSDRHYIFCQLYFKSAYRNASEVKKSMHLSVSVATLCRYRKKFVEAFIYFQKKCSRFRLPYIRRTRKRFYALRPNRNFLTPTRSRKLRRIPQRSQNRFPVR